MAWSHVVSELGTDLHLRDSVEKMSLGAAKHTRAVALKAAEPLQCDTIVI
jgi:acetoin utilization deacetylase AcuC-like enzyme